jgi:hypothetical protein
MAPKNPEISNQEDFKILDEKVKSIQTQISLLEKDTLANKITPAGRAELNALKWEISNFDKVEWISKKWSDWDISPRDKRQANRLAREIKKYESRLEGIKKSLGIDEFAEPKSPRRYDIDQNDADIDAKGNITLTNETTTTTHWLWAVPTQEQKAAAYKNFDAGKATAADYKIMWAWMIDHVVSKSTNATPEQAKMIKYWAIAAWWVMLWKMLNSNIPWWIFSLNGIAAMGAIYAGTTMATGMNPLEFASAMINGGNYPLLGVDDKKWSNKASEVKKSMDSSTMSDHLINGFKNDDSIATYLKVDPKDPSKVIFDKDQLWKDISIDGQPIENWTQLRCALDEGKINSIFKPYHDVAPNKLMAIMLAFFQDWKEDMLNEALTNHLNNIKWWSSIADLLANPSKLKEESTTFKKKLSDKAKMLTSYVLNKSELDWYSITPEHEIALLNEMITMEKEKDPNFNQNPSTYTPTLQDRLIVKERLLSAGHIKSKDIINDAEAKIKEVRRIDGLVSWLLTDHMHFAESFVKMKIESDPQNIHDMDVVVRNGIVWIQAGTAAFACSGSSKDDFAISFDHSNTSIQWSLPGAVAWYENKLAMGMAACILSGMAAGNIIYKWDKKQTETYSDYPFMTDGKSISVSNNPSWFQSLFNWWDRYTVVDTIMTKLWQQWGTGTLRWALCAWLNGMKFKPWTMDQYGNNVWGRAVWSINNGKLPPEMMRMNPTTGKRMEAGFSTGTNYIISDQSFVGWYKNFLNGLSSASGATYDALVKWAMEKLYPDIKKAAEDIYGDGVDSVRQIYTDVKDGFSMMLVDLKDDWFKIMKQVLTEAWVQMIDMTHDISVEAYNKLLKPFYKEFKKQIPGLYADLTDWLVWLHDSAKRWAKIAQTDIELLYENAVLPTINRVWWDASDIIDKVGRELAAKLWWITDVTIQWVFNALWMTWDAAQQFMAKNPKMTGAITYLLSNAAWVSHWGSFWRGIGAAVLSSVFA